MPVTLGQVWPHKKIPAWEGPNSKSPVFETVGVEALLSVHMTDAHFVPYFLEGSKVCPRLYKEAVADWPVRFQVVPVDCDPPDHNPTPAWRKTFRAACEGLGFAWYATTGGGRALFALAEPVDVDGFLAIQNRAIQALREKGATPDENCVNQWNRAYRLPFVLRDFDDRPSELQQHPAHLIANLPVLRIDQIPVNSNWLAGQESAVTQAKFSLDGETASVGGRNSLLTRHAGKLRGKGIDGQSLLEELLVINDRLCDPPLPVREVSTIARNAMRWDRTESADAPEPVQNNEPLERADEVCIATRLLEEIGQYKVGSLGELWVYDAERGVWAGHDQDDLARLAARFSGFPYIAGYDKDGEPKFAQLNMRNAGCKGVAAIALRQHKIPRFFDDEASGIAFANGFYGRSGLVAHDKSFRARVACPFDYVPSAEPVGFIQYLTDVFKHPDTEGDTEDLVQLLREMIAVYAAGLAPTYQKAFVLLGDGGNGKSVFLDVVASLFPDEDAVTAIPPQEWGQEYRRALLAHARINLIGELPGVRIMAAEMVKAMITGDALDARQIRGVPFRFRCKAGHLFSANKLPGTHDLTEGFWRRWVVVPFFRKFTEAEKDPYITKRLIETEQSLILSWAMDSLAGVIARGGFDTPTCCDRELSKWRQSADQIACFLEEDPSVSKPNWEMTGNQLYQQYKGWAMDNGHRDTVTGRVFWQRVQGVDGIVRKRSSAGAIYIKRALNVA